MFAKLYGKRFLHAEGSYSKHSGTSQLKCIKSEVFKNCIKFFKSWAYIKVAPQPFVCQEALLHGVCDKFS